MKKKQKGFTYLEVMLALVIIGIVIVPIGSGMVSSIKTVLYSKTIQQATQNAETVMAAVKEKIDMDVKATPKGENPPSYADKKAKELNSFIGGKYAAVINNPDYDYEVVVLPAVEGNMIINRNGTVDDKICLKLTTIIGEDGQPAFTQLEDDVLAEFDLQIQDKLNTNRDNLKSHDISAVFKEGMPWIQLNKNGGLVGEAVFEYIGIEAEKSNIQFSKSSVDDTNIYQITNCGTGNQKVIYIDARPINLKSEGTVTKDIRIVNKTNETILIKLMDSGKRVNIFLEQNPGKLILQRPDNVEKKKNYIIAVLVREKKDQAVFGKKGKILEKLIDVYSCTEE